MLNLKIFQGILSHLYGNYKQDIEGECGPNIGKQLFLKKQILGDKNLHLSQYNSAKYELFVL